MDCDGRPVLLVDDDKMYTLALKRFLQRKGIPVTVCHRLADALVHDGVEFRAAILDVYVEGDKDGLRLVQRLRHLQPHLPVVVITGMASDEVRAAVRRVGADFLLAKPFRLAHLFEVLEEMLARDSSPLPSKKRHDVLVAFDGCRGTAIANLLEVEGLRVHRAVTAVEAVRALDERPNVRAIVVQESLAGGAALVAQRVENLGLTAMLVIGCEAGVDVPVHWRPAAGKRLSLPASPDEIIGIIRQCMTASTAEIERAA